MDYAEDVAGSQNRSNFKKSSVQWGCPQWTRVQDAISRAGSADYWYFLTKDNQCGYAMNDAFATQRWDDPLENGWWYIDNNHYSTADGTANARWDAKDTDPYPLLVSGASIPYASGQPLVHDGYLAWSHPWYQAYSSNPEMVIERHRNKGNVVYVDGHAGKLSGKEWQSASGQPWAQ